jgi:hypothetical protein
MSPSRQVKTQAELAVLADDTVSHVRLAGGPMDGFLVFDDAPALAADWYRTWPRDVSSEFRPGRYVIASETEQATPIARWREYPGEQP